MKSNDADLTAPVPSGASKTAMLESAFAALEAPHIEQLRVIGEAIGYGRSCQILGELWDEKLAAAGIRNGRGAMERRMDIELAEAAKVAWRALCDAEAVINTIDGEDVLESINLEELQGRIGACAGNLFCLLGLPTSALIARSA